MVIFWIWKNCHNGDENNALESALEIGKLLKKVSWKSESRWRNRKAVEEDFLGFLGNQKAVEENRILS
jgi:hypothetical protein